MIRHKKFARMLAVMLICYFLFNFCVWHLYTNRLVNDAGCVGGDLTRMGYITGSKMCRQQQDDLPLRHLERDEYRGEPVDVLTIGDSFSNGGGGGRNTYYQDYLASLNGFTVLNIPEYKDIDRVSTMSLLNNNGFLDRIKPKYVLIECSEKQCLEGFPENVDFEKSIPEQELNKYQTVSFAPAAPKDRQLMDFFSEANFKLVRNCILYNFSDNAYGGKVYKAKLDRPLFSVETPDTLLFFSGDIQYRKKTPARIAKLNAALNTLHDRLAEKGIRLYFMPCVDKYNLYSDYIVENRHPRSIFFEELRKLPKRYQYVDTKSILLGELEKGEKDIYYADDTHWSWKASEKVFKAVRFQGI